MDIIKYENELVVNKKKEIFADAKKRFFKNQLARTEPLWEKMSQSLLTEDGRGYSNIEFVVTLEHVCHGMGIEINYLANTSSIPRNGLYNQGYLIPEFDFTQLNDRILYIFPEARFGYKTPRVDFALYYKDGFYTYKRAIEIQTSEHFLNKSVLENDVEKAQHLQMLNWIVLPFTAKQVFYDEQGKFLIPILGKLLQDAEKMRNNEVINNEAF